ncbi:MULTISPECIES: GntR family transcriptional regulator [unclassified Nocardioides]|uniref:GntR family transcriptional regulator n=1 Tax=unclassified Nocardioides TaxID=2615069 RepID=UPI0030151162
MVAAIRVSAQSELPVYRQIVAQLRHMVETGQLRDGERLPGSRMLADNLGLNRHTVAHAYGELRDLGLVESRGRSGMIVVGAQQARATSAARDRAREVLEAAARECLRLGLPPAEIQELALAVAVTAVGTDPRIAFVECNAGRSSYFAEEIGQELDLPVTALVLGRFDPEDVEADLVLTTFFHLAEVRALLRRPATDVVALNAAPHVQTLVELAQVPRDQVVGLWFETEEQTASVRDSLTQAGVTHVRTLAGTTEDDLRGVDVVVVPSGLPEHPESLRGRRVVEFGNVLDAASIRMVHEVVRDLRIART